MNAMALDLKDYGNDPFVINIDDATLQNEDYRVALWTGEEIQITLMSIPPGGDIGGEVHEGHDQFLRLEAGHGKVIMGNSEDEITFEKEVGPDDVILIPKGKFHNVMTVGDEPMKLYSIYGPAHHPQGTRQATKEIAMEEEADHH